MIGRRHWFQRNRTYSLQEVFFIVSNKDPVQVKQRIGKPEIKMLVFVDLVKLLRVTKSKKWFRVDIIIQAVNIGIGVVDHIVFCFPHKNVRTKKIERQCSKVVDPFIPAETTVTAIMHNVETNSSGETTQCNTLNQRQPYGRRVKHQVNVSSDKTHNKNYRLKVKVKVTGG